MILFLGKILVENIVRVQFQITHNCTKIAREYSILLLIYIHFKDSITVYDKTKETRSHRENLLFVLIYFSPNIIVAYPLKPLSRKMYFKLTSLQLLPIALVSQLKHRNQEG